MEKRKETLSQEEVDTLLGEIDEIELGNVKTTAIDSGEVRNYDFSSQERIVSSSMLGLYAINERFIRNFRTSLMNLLRRGVNVSLSEIISIKAHEYLATLSTPSCINFFRMRPLQGLSLCVFDTPLVFTLVDSLFGGGNLLLTDKKEREEFTQMEMRIVHLVLDLIFRDLNTAWQTIYSVKFEGQGSEINPQLVNMGGQNEIIIVTCYKILLEGVKPMELHISIPYSTLEPIRSLLESGSIEKEDVDEDWTSRLREEVYDAPIKLNADIAHAYVPFKALSQFKVGDIIPVEFHDVITVLAAGLPTFRGRFGIANDNCAIKIIGRVDRN